MERFAPQDNFDGPFLAELSSNDRICLVNDLAIFAECLGDIARARRAYQYNLEVSRQDSNPRHNPDGEENLGGLEYVAGNFVLAAELGHLSLESQAERQNWKISAGLATRAAAHGALGEMDLARVLFQLGTEKEGSSLICLRGAFEAEFKILQGLFSEALAQAEDGREAAIRNSWGDDLCRFNALLPRLCKDDPALASRYLADARAFASDSGFVELQLDCFLAACELQNSLGDHGQAITEAEAGMRLADSCGFGKYSIDLRLPLAEVLLAAANPAQALPHAREALDRSEAPECRYAWGQADALHLCGIAHLRLGERKLAQQRLTAALEIRERLDHPRIEETRTAWPSCSKENSLRP